MKTTPAQTQPAPIGQLGIGHPGPLPTIEVVEHEHPPHRFSLPCVECGAPVYLGDDDEHGAEFASWCDSCCAKETDDSEPYEGNWS